MDFSTDNSVIRDATAADLPAIVAIYNSAVPCQIITADTELITVESRIAWFQAHSPERYPLWVLEKNHQVAGWLGFQQFYGRPAYRATVEVSLYVAPEFQRQGVGKTLLGSAIAQAPKLGVKTLLGLVFAENQPSLNLLKQFQFEQWGYLPRVAQFGEVERDLVLLGCKIQRC
jgi:L-amino acid N-acyltransferase YncA